MKILSFVLMLALISCSGMRMAETEKEWMLPLSGEKTWVISGVGKYKNGNHIHQCILARATVNENGCQMDIFASAQEKPENFHYVVCKGTPGEKLSKGRFPFLVNAGSKGHEVILRLTRHSVSISEDRHPDIPPERLYWQSKFQAARAYAWEPVKGFAGLADCLPRSAAFSTNETREMEGTTFFRAFTGDDSFLSLAGDSAALLMLDIALEPEISMSALFRVTREGGVEQLWLKIRNAMDELHPDERIEFEASGDAFWQSRTSAQTYPLRLRVKGLPGKGNLLIAPCFENAELSLGKHSFWMGGIRLRDEISGKDAGAGNMFIFNAGRVKSQ